MARTINEVMTHDPRTVSADAPLTEVAKVMAEADIGDVLVEDSGKLEGIVTDRDIVVRALAEGRDPSQTKARDVETKTVQALTPDQSVEEAIRVMRENDVRRVPVVQDGRPVGIVSIGDLAVERDSGSALADISAASPNN
jgi:CBS domain-containing protein